MKVNEESGGTHFIGWIVSRIDLDVVMKRKIPLLSGIRPWLSIL
jgi:hypothetical protein